MRFVIAFGLAYGAALLQSLFGDELPLLRGRPDLPLVLVLAWAMLRGSADGAVVGFLAGLFLDSVRSTPFGVNAALLGLLGYVTGLPEANVYRGNFPFFLGTAALATLAYHTLLLLALQAFGFGLPPPMRTFEVALPAALLNAVLLGPAFVLCRRLLRMLDGWTQLKL